MSNFPTLTPEAAELLMLIEDTYFKNSRGPRLPLTKHRTELKKLGLIRSLALNANVLLPAAAGNGRQWQPTPLGIEIALALKKERREHEPPFISMIMQAALAKKAAST